MRTTYPPKVIFKNAMSISYSDTYQTVWYEDQEDTSYTFSYGSYYKDGVSRSMFDVFYSPTTATQVVDATVVGQATQQDPFRLMTITRESRMVDNENEDYSYVLACGSTEFLSSTLLLSNTYGNTDLMLSALRATGREFIPVGLDLKPFVGAVQAIVASVESSSVACGLIGRGVGFGM